MKPLFTLTGTAAGWSNIVTDVPGSGTGFLAVLNVQVWNATFAEYVNYPVALDDVSGEFAEEMNIIGKRISVDIIHMDCVHESRNFCVVAHSLFFGIDLKLS